MPIIVRQGLEGLLGQLAVQAGQEQFFTFRAVQVTQEPGRKGCGRAVINHLAVAQCDGSRAVFQRVFNLVQRHQHGHGVAMIEICQDVHHLARR